MAIAASGQQLKDKISNDITDLIKDSSRIWKVSLGRRNENTIYDDCKKNNCIALGWDELGSLHNKAYDDILEILSKTYSINSSWTSAASSLNNFVNQMSIGDLVLIYDGPQTIRDIGVITGDYYYDKSRKFSHRRSVNWIKEFKDKPADIFEYNGHIRLTMKSVYELERINISDIRNLVGEERNTQRPQYSLPYYLIIDEINRGNIAKIFGELITLLEKDKREKVHCYLPYSKKKFTLPSNLYIIGTMNTADRSIALLDTALRRRFAFIEIEPDSNVFNNPNLNVSVTVNDTIDLPQLFETLNERITREFDRDHRIGHAYFINIVNLNDLYHVWYYNIIPLLMEYFYNDSERLRRVIGKGFIKPDGSVRFLSIKSDQGLSEFEQAILKIMKGVQIDE
ncbi:MAG: AAA domain-containing protein [Clostridiaceae bacterium]|nr:AAA domain-containing protein [Clostridiaceae bacterium]